MSAIVRRFAWRFGRKMYMQARKDGPNDMHTNGEIFFLRSALLTSPAPTVFDVGASVGEWSRVALSNTSQKAELHAFEPIPSTFAELQRSVTDSRAKLNCVALSDSRNQLTAYEYGTGTSSLHHDPTKVMPAGIPIVTTTVDLYLRENDILEVNYLKCDTEGHDLAVIRGARRSLTDGKIAILQFEYNHRWVYSHSFLLDVFEFVADLPYLVGKIVPRGLEVYDGWHPELERFFEGNYALVRNDMSSSLPISRGTFDGSNTYRH